MLPRIVSAIHIAGGAVTGDYDARYTGHDGVVGDIARHDRIGAYRHIAANDNFSDQHGPRTDVYVVAKYWTAFADTAVGLTDGHAMRKVAVPPEHGVRVHYDSAEMADIQTGSDTGRVGDGDAIPDFKTRQFERYNVTKAKPKKWMARQIPTQSYVKGIPESGGPNVVSDKDRCRSPSFVAKQVRPNQEPEFSVCHRFRSVYRLCMNARCPVSRRVDGNAGSRSSREVYQMRGVPGSNGFRELSSACSMTSAKGKVHRNANRRESGRP